MTIVSVGKLVKQTRDGAFNVTEWSSDVPISQAVFRYLGEFYNKTITDETTRMELAAYLPPGGSSTSDVLVDMRNSVRVFTDWFGPPAYSRLSVVGGGANDSLPGLVYASPGVTAGYSSLTAQGLVAACAQALGSDACLSQPAGPPGTSRTALDEAFSFQVARQWWGNTVSPVSFHDAWLSSGLANFSTSLYDLAVSPGEFGEHWVRARENLLRPPVSFLSTVRPIDVGPVWMGVLNDTYKTRGAGYLLSTLKGGYILHMLRSLMWDSQEGDADFRAMMHDFVKQFANQSVSTENFQSLVEKHMKPPMDMDGNHRMDWFFGEWVYGADIPSYRLEYSLSREKGSRPLLTGKLTQYGVSPGFKMIVPVFAEFAGKEARVAIMAMRGNSTRDFNVTLPAAPKRIVLNLNHDVLTDKEEITMVK